MWVSFSLISLSDSGPWQTATWAKLGCCLIGFRHSFIIGMFRLELVAVYIESAEWYLGIRLIWYDHQREVSPASASHQPQPWHYVLFIWTFYYATNKLINRFSSTVERVRVHDRYLNINILYINIYLLNAYFYFFIVISMHLRLFFSSMSSTRLYFVLPVPIFW